MQAGPAKAAATPSADAVAQELRAKELQLQAELEMLKRKMQQKEKLLHMQQERQQAKEAEHQQQQQKQAELQRKKAAIAKGFAAVADPLATDAGGQGQGKVAKTVVSVTDADLQRILDSKCDYACLQLHIGANSAQVRKSYRQLAMALHPDKCKLEGAADAFQKVNAAYNRLLKHMA